MSRNFTERITSLPCIAHTVAQDGTNILAVNNQLLVDAHFMVQVQAALTGLDVVATLLTTLLDGLQWRPEHDVPTGDVNIYELSPGPGSKFNPASRRHGIFSLTDQLRIRLDGIVPAASVSPNHILIPAPNVDECPFGAPSPAPGNWQLAALQGPYQDVTVIDSGWQWDEANWGPNPLHGHVHPRQAERLPTLLESNAGANWQDGFEEEPGELAPGTHKLVALAGHSNFIAGVIASRCHQARITVLSHNGSFIENQNRPSLSTDPATDPNRYDFPTEAAVARSLCWAMSKNATELGFQTPKVINIGFAFLPWGDPNAALADDVVSCIWERAFQFVGPGPIVVSPAGNQDSSLRRYPAALWKKDPVLFERMIGVGSIDEEGELIDLPAEPYVRQFSADFTNHGDAATGDDWVICSAIGSNVISTFLPLNTALEDREDDEVLDFTTNSWAVWNGTSFAAPKVVAGIARRLALGDPDPWTAWQNLANTGVQPSPQPPGDPTLGIMFPRP